MRDDGDNSICHRRRKTIIIRVMPIEKPYGQTDIVNPVFQRGFVPKEGGRLMVSLTGELAKSSVIEVYGEDVVVVRLEGPLMTQVGHNHHADDIICVERAIDPMQSKEIWVPVDERKYRARELARELAGEAMARRTLAPPECEPAPQVSVAAADGIGSSSAAAPILHAGLAEAARAAAEAEENL